MNDRFKRALTVSTAVHLGIVVLLILAPLFTRLLQPRKPKEMITFIDLVQALPEPPAPPRPEPVKEPVVPDKQPDPKSRPEPPKIKVNTNRVVRRDDPKPAPPKQTPKLTEAQIRKLLDADLTLTHVAGSPAGEFSDLALYHTQVQQKMYDAWQQPSAVARGLSATVAIRVQRNGAVTQRRLTRSSGSAAMDASVMRAVESVSRLPPLPAEIGGPHLDIPTVEFVVDGGP